MKVKEEIAHGITCPNPKCGMDNSSVRFSCKGCGWKLRI